MPSVIPSVVPVKIAASPVDCINPLASIDMPEPAASAPTALALVKYKFAPSITFDVDMLSCTAAMARALVK